MKRLRPLSLLVLLGVSWPAAQALGAEGFHTVSSPQEQAQFLAGIPLSRASVLHGLQSSPEYGAHQRQLREQWEFCRRIRYEAMRRWASEHLSRYPATRGVLRYLFGGPDFLNAYAFFPDTRTMVLGGLEPVGEVPPPEALSPQELGPALTALDEALRTSLFAGYFITSEMKPQLAQGAFRGVLPVLYTELALTGNIVDTSSPERPFGAPGVRITYHRPGGPEQTLWYFQADLSNGRECRNFLAWLGELGPGASYLKAASYLLPLDSFSETRNFLMRTSELILQDDSGLPFRSFLPGEWRLSLFGVYTEPLPIFKLRRDPALAGAYESPLRVGPLPFGAGYHVNAGDANLLLALREDQARGPGPIVSGAPPAVAAFATPVREPRMKVRKALPIPIKKAIPVAIPTATPTPTPRPTPQPVIPPAVAPVIVPVVAPTPNQAPTPTPTPQPPMALPPNVEPEPIIPAPAAEASPEPVSLPRTEVTPAPEAATEIVPVEEPAREPTREPVQDSWPDPASPSPEEPSPANTPGVEASAPAAPTPEGKPID